jgi:ATP-binding cassette subfamily B protein
MKFLRLYGRVLELLGPEARLGWALALAGVALAAANFVEPILFGRIVDTLANAQGGSRQLDYGVLLPLVGAWVGFGLFIIVASTIVSLHADRLSHRHCQVVRADYFEHILQLPLSYHTGTHSGRLMKVMITGTNTLWGMWLSFFREHFTSFVSLFILMPLTLFLNWRYGLMLMFLCAIFAALIAFVLRKTETLQSTVETYYTDQAERTPDTRRNIALIHSFARLDMEVCAIRKGG